MNPKTERNRDSRRGAKESPAQIETLRERWPAAFPDKAHLVRPLEVTAAGKIATAMGWSLAYAWGVLAPWKARATYCKACLAYDVRITLGGEPAEPVGDEARGHARDQLARLAARKERAAAPAAVPKVKPVTSSPAAVRNGRPVTPPVAPKVDVQPATSSPAVTSAPEPALPAPQPKLPPPSSGRLGLAGLKAAYRQRQQAGAA
jgi:sRNA-binding protein